MNFHSKGHCTGGPMIGPVIEGVADSNPETTDFLTILAACVKVKRIYLIS